MLPRSNEVLNPDYIDEPDISAEERLAKAQALRKFYAKNPTPGMHPSRTQAIWFYAILLPFAIALWGLIIRAVLR
jgi:hypothetical protein